jgi:hypothetical protein
MYTPVHTLLLLLLLLQGLSLDVSSRVLAEGELAGALVLDQYAQQTKHALSSCSNML